MASRIIKEQPEQTCKGVDPDPHAYGPPLPYIKCVYTPMAVVFYRFIGPLRLLVKLIV